MIKRTLDLASGSAIKRLDPWQLGKPPRSSDRIVAISATPLGFPRRVALGLVTPLAAGPARNKAASTIGRRESCAVTRVNPANRKGSPTQVRPTSLTSTPATASASVPQRRDRFDGANGPGETRTFQTRFSTAAPRGAIGPQSGQGGHKTIGPLASRTTMRRPRDTSTAERTI